MPGIPWNNPVKYIKNVGPRRAALLSRLGINSVGDLLYHFPREYEDRTRLKPAHACDNGERAIIKGRVVGAEEIKPRKGLTITKLSLYDGYGLFYAVWYNQPFVKKQLKEGDWLLLTGKVSRFMGQVQLQVQDYELEDGPETVHAGLLPVYPLTEQLSQRVLRMAVKSALDEWAGGLSDFLPASLIAKYRLPALGPAMQMVHFPQTPEDYRAARRRFIFEELFLQQIIVTMRRHRMVAGVKRHDYKVNSLLEAKYLSFLPFSLTPGQKSAWEEISRDMNGNTPMYRLLQGDVGAGKTVVCVLALLKAVDSGLQAVLMAPTEVLAEQHYKTIVKYFSSLGLNTALLTGGMKKKKRQEILKRIMEGKIEVVLGTHALLQEDVVFKSLAMVVIDEQHRFGVRQRALLQFKGNQPDVLVMTATPIPRTLALTLYGDLAVSTISDMPPGRMPVHTFFYRQSQLAGVYKKIREQVAMGRQAYIVCPLVEESEKIDLLSAVELASELTSGEFESCRVDLLHGRMKTEEKEDVISRFRDGFSDVLISTTVVEVGVDVPNATVMVIMDAHRFGLAQLHQLRGRVGRGGHSSVCYLISDARAGEAKARLEAMCQTGNGFLLAEKDLELRGPGELFGTRQSGAVTYRIADPLRDIRTLEVARKDAAELLLRDPYLGMAEHRSVLEELKKRFDKDLIFINVG
jgi:ATP-dependent DNA helicase RecG